MINLDLFFLIHQGMLPWQPILGKFGKMTFIPKWILAWQFRFNNIEWQYCSYIVCKFDQDRSSNRRDYDGNNWTRWQKSAYPTKYLGKYWTDLHQTLVFVDMCIRIIKLT